jgi:O-antigen/teichoic acid export membrane protein
MIYSRKYVQVKVAELISFKYLKENISLGIYTIMTSMYLTFNVMYLGLVSDNVSVGYYTSAFKLYHLILSVFTAFTSVMLPRMSSLVTQGDHEKFQYFIRKSVDFVALVSIPLIVCCTIMTPEIINLLCGPGYEGAIMPMRIIMPAILPVGLAQILAIQILIPLKRDKVLLAASIVGAVLSLIINVTLVSRLQSVGSALVLLCSEFAVTLFYLIYAHKHQITKISVRSFMMPVLKTIPCAVICLLCQRLISDLFLSLTLAVAFSLTVFAVLNVNQIKSLIKK